MLLEVRDLHVEYAAAGRTIRAVAGLSLTIERGQAVGLVGESGCGKTATALSILRLLPEPTGRIAGGSILFAGIDLATCPARQLRQIRGRRIGIVFQEPAGSLNPVLTVGEQIAEVLRLHQGLNRRAAAEQTVELLQRVGVPALKQRTRQYPHELSGGLRQRVMIAMALAGGPELLIGDEPTGSLDVTVQAQILRLLCDLRAVTGLAMLFITHDLALVAALCDVVCVMYAGRIVERAPRKLLLSNPRHPYTQGLLRCTPALGGKFERRQRLPVIPGDVTTSAASGAGCAFQPRCPVHHDDPRCASCRPTPVEVNPDHACACWHVAGEVPHAKKV